MVIAYMGGFFLAPVPRFCIVVLGRGCDGENGMGRGGRASLGETDGVVLFRPLGKEGKWYDTGRYLYRSGIA